MHSRCQTVVDLVDSFGTVSSPSACRLGGMQTDELDGGTRTKQQPRVCLPSSEPHNHGQKSCTECYARRRRSATRVLRRQEKWATCRIRRAPTASYALASATSSAGWEKRLGASSPEVHSVGLCQHDSCSLVTMVACSNIWNWHAATAWSHAIHPPYRLRSTPATSPPHTETQRDLSRPADRVNYTPVTRVVRIHIATRSRSCVQRHQVIAGRCDDLDHPTHRLGQYSTRPCSPQTSSPSSKRKRPAGLLALRVPHRFRPQATGSRLETDYSGVLHLTSGNLRRVPNSQTAARSPFCGALGTCRRPYTANHWLSPTAAVPHQ
jgi:hypothetical protein